MEIKIINYDEGDWVSVVKDGKIVYGNHSLDWESLLEILDVNSKKDLKIEKINFEGTEEEWDELMNQFGGES